MHRVAREFIFIFLFCCLQVSRLWIRSNLSIFKIESH